jgi:hypothetical protein
MANISVVPLESIQRKILLIRGKKVMIDADLAEIYGVTTKVLNQAVKRNKDRFPLDFMFKLTKTEKKEVVTKCDHLEKLKYSPSLPNAFTEHGAIMLATVLNSPVAVSASIQVVRAFVRLREIIATHHHLVQKLNELERKLGKHDDEIRVLFEAIKQLMRDEKKPKREIGFRIKENIAKYKRKK